MNSVNKYEMAPCHLVKLNRDNNVLILTSKAIPLRLLLSEGRVTDSNLTNLVARFLILC